MREAPPAVNDWKELFAVAAELRHQAPWKWMYDSDVFGGQKKYFGVPAKNGTFDYDCSGTAEKQFTESVNCALVICPTGQGYLGIVPACGQNGNWGVCSGLPCTGQVTEANKTQLCH